MGTPPEHHVHHCTYFSATTDLSSTKSANDEYSKALHGGSHTVRGGGGRTGLVEAGGPRESPNLAFVLVPELLAPATAAGGGSSNTRTAALNLYFFLHREVRYDLHSMATLTSTHRHSASSRSSAGTVQGLRSGSVLEYTHFVHELMFPVQW